MRGCVTYIVALIAMKVEEQKRVKSVCECKDELKWWGGERLEGEDTEEPVEGEEGKEDDGRTERGTNLVKVHSVRQWFSLKVALQYEQH